MYADPTREELSEVVNDGTQTVIGKPSNKHLIYWSSLTGRGSMLELSWVGKLPQLCTGLGETKPEPSTRKFGSNQSRAFRETVQKCVKAWTLLLSRVSLTVPLSYKSYQYSSIKTNLQDQHIKQQDVQGFIDLCILCHRRPCLGSDPSL